LDIKLENIGSTEFIEENLQIIEPKKFRLFDFDMSLFFENKESNIKFSGGTPGYAAPEIINGGVAYIKSDVYSLSILISFVFFKSEGTGKLKVPFTSAVSEFFNKKAIKLNTDIENKNINDPSIKRDTFKRDMYILISQMSKIELSDRITSKDAREEFIKISNNFLGISQPTDAADTDTTADTADTAATAAAADTAAMDTANTAAAAATREAKIKLPQLPLALSPRSPQSSTSPSSASTAVTKLPPIQLKRGGKSRKIRRNRIQKRSIKRSKSVNIITNYTITKNVKQSYNRRRRRRFKHILN
jgi:serine/threonine protein kinase